MLFSCGSIFNIFILLSYLGGNQRELARAKNLKKQQQGQAKGKGEDGLTLEQRKQR